MAVTAEARREPHRRLPHLLTGVHRRRNELHSTLTISALGFSGKLLGLVKTLVIAAWFGASAALDAFWVAYAIPAILPGMVRGVVATAFIPGFMRSSLQGGSEIDWRGLNTLFTGIGLLVLAAVAAVALGRDAIVTFMAPGLDAATHTLAAELVALMAIAMLFFGINAMFAAILQALRRFAVMSLESVITNVVIIATCILFADSAGVRGLALAVIAGFAMHTVLLVWANRDLLRLYLRPAFDWSHADFREPARHMLPLLIGYMGAVAMSLIDRMFVSTLEAGMISVLAYASMIALLPMEVFGQAVMTAFYPSLSHDHARADENALRETHRRGLRLLLFVMLPTTAALVFAAAPLVSLLLERGAFSATAANYTALTLAALALALPARAVNYFNFRVFHARQEPWTAVGIGLFGVALNAGLDWLLIDDFGIVGIAFATSAATIASALLSTVLLQRRLACAIVRPLLAPAGKFLLATALLIAVAWLFAAVILDVFTIPPGWPTAAVKLAGFLPGAAAFLLAGELMGVEETRQLLGLMRGRRNALPRKEQR